MVTVKEFRIAMPMKVEEYRRAQLYMIMKKSKEESEGEDSGVEILKNEPYIDGPGGSGQYTEKIYYVQKHLPSMVQAVLPKGALTVKECSWNAYPYTKTVFTTSALDKFNILIETKFLPDPGVSENVFGLTIEERENTVVDVLDMCREKTGGKEEEDPTVFSSAATGRGPLPKDWLEVTQQQDPSERGDVMCSYKLCKVEFKYWGIQRKMENWILDLALRKTILKGHQQAWAWQDEWYHLKMEDIRRLERETQQKLALKFKVSSQDMAGPLEDLTPIPSYEQDEEVGTSEDEFFDALSRTSGSTMTRRDSTRESDHTYDSVANFGDLGLEESPGDIINLILVVHTANILGFEANADDDVQVFRSTIQAVLKSQFPTVNQSMVHVEQITLSNVNEQLLSVAKACAVNTQTSPHISLLAASDKRWPDTVNELQDNIEEVIAKYVVNGKRFEGQVYIVGDVLGGIISYDMISRMYEPDVVDSLIRKSASSLEAQNTCKRSASLRSRQSTTDSIGSYEGSFDISGLVLFNCPLAYCLLRRRYAGERISLIPVPLFNLFYPIDQNAARLEPVFMEDQFPQEPMLLCRRDLSNSLFNFSSGYESSPSTPTAPRRRPLNLRSLFTRSISKKSPVDSTGSSPNNSRHENSLDIFANDKRRCHSSTGTVLSASDFAAIDTGCSRIDYMLSCPEGLATMSSKCLPQYLYAAFWESADAASLLLKQALYEETQDSVTTDELSSQKTAARWQRRRTTLKVRNLEPNHRAQDCVCIIGDTPKLSGRFSYGLFDVAVLTGEKVELQVGSEVSDTGWETIDVKDTDSNGKVTFVFPTERCKSAALYNIRLNVAGDNSSSYLSLAVLPRQSKCVVFSIDSSFAASVSILGTDPRVRPAAVDVARFWTDNGYMVIYISSRPDMMKNRVVSWLRQHNFPIGLNFFQKGIHHDPYAKKCEMLKKLIAANELNVVAAYGGTKDLQIYRSINISTRSIFVVGSKGKTKLQNMGTVLCDGYNVHLDWLRNSSFQMAQAAVNSRLLVKRRISQSKSY